MPLSRRTRKARVCGPFVGIGETGFEPATARPPAGCATRLRHSPRSVSRAGDGNRTRPRSLEGFCATTTLRPRVDRAILTGGGIGARPREWALAVRAVSRRAIREWRRLRLGIRFASCRSRVSTSRPCITRFATPTRRSRRPARSHRCWTGGSWCSSSRPGADGRRCRPRVGSRRE
jgi:hypothetical protein